MRVLTAEDRLHFCHISLNIKCFQIMRHTYQVLLRCQFIVRVPPVSVTKDTQSSFIGELDDTILDRLEIRCRRDGWLMP